MQGDKENTAVTAETAITVIDREQSAFNLNEPAEGAASYEVPMAFNEDQTYDYDTTAKAIYNAVASIYSSGESDSERCNNQIQRRNRS